ncbi:uncharacterized protein CLUP02_08379 [Colletotrichum lupini]|uniref:Uncharacterized protein n=1 Tax=Colletotrichum lupini TaxID=145971 RepID=A0A9Q8SSQ1_9PEZI|nr:uncharacterized protein CLUP02_08379 [Colletotrichum lupini]UQC82889.1 hypothetical protein CLUP02_08379 [Colletotrichum lupini]
MASSEPIMSFRSPTPFYLIPLNCTDTPRRGMLDELPWTDCLEHREAKSLYAVDRGATPDSQMTSCCMHIHNHPAKPFPEFEFNITGIQIQLDFTKFSHAFSNCIIPRNEPSTGHAAPLYLPSNTRHSAAFGLACTWGKRDPDKSHVHLLRVEGRGLPRNTPPLSASRNLSIFFVPQNDSNIPLLILLSLTVAVAVSSAVPCRLPFLEPSARVNTARASDLSAHGHGLVRYLFGHFVGPCYFQGGRHQPAPFQAVCAGCDCIVRTLSALRGLTEERSRHEHANAFQNAIVV